MNNWVRHRWTLFVVLGILLSLYQGLNAAIGARKYFPVWQPLVWEASSVCLIFALIPLILRFENRFRIDARPRSKTFLIHLGAAIVFSAVHTAGMVFLRKLAYWAMGSLYDFGEVFTQWFYELQKDL